MHREKDLAQPLARTIGFPLSSGQIGGDSQFYYKKVKDKINQFAKQGVKSIWVVWERAEDGRALSRDRSFIGRAFREFNHLSHTRDPHT